MSALVQFGQTRAAHRTALRVLRFILETTVLGGIVLWRGLRWLIHLRYAMATELRCPAGHSVPTYGRSQCRACGATREGYLLRCSLCGARPAYVLCPTCGLAVRGPLR